MKAIPRPQLPSLPVRFEVGTHVVIVELQGRRWSMSVDGQTTATTFPSEAEAWEAGVREADRIDRAPGGV
jgi:hypothetical protein